MQEKERINEGHRIIKSLRIGKVEFVVGENIYDGCRYVTWEYSEVGGYYWGHYFNDKRAAIEDMFDRAEQELSCIRSRDIPQQKQEEREER